MVLPLLLINLIADQPVADRPASGQTSRLILGSVSGCSGGRLSGVLSGMSGMSSG
jgi:hypothetical protein